MTKAMTIIEQLKKNEKPFGLMSAEMQEKAIELKLSQFQYYGYIYRWYDMNESWDEKPFETLKVYRLRPDYQEEPEIVECEILPPDDEGIKWVQRTPSHTMDYTSCEMHKDFIGFKFEDGAIGPTSVHYRSAAGVLYCKLGDGRLDNMTVLHATHVLFRGQQ